jgi:hypothetical protein
MPELGRANSPSRQRLSVHCALRNNSNILFMKLVAVAKRPNRRIYAMNERGWFSRTEVKANRCRNLLMQMLGVSQDKRAYPKYCFIEK